MAVSLGVLSGAAVKLPALLGIPLDRAPELYARNASFFVLPLVTLFFAWRRSLSPAVGG